VGDKGGSVCLNNGEEEREIGAHIGGNLIIKKRKKEGKGRRFLERVS